MKNVVIIDLYLFSAHILKIFEKCIYEQLYSYLIKYNILAPNPFGFKQNWSTSQAVRLLYDELVQNIDQKQIICCIFFISVRHLIQLIIKY